MDATTENENRSWSKLRELATADDDVALDALRDALAFEAAAVWGEIVHVGGNDLHVAEASRLGLRDDVFSLSGRIGHRGDA